MYDLEEIKKLFNLKKEDKLKEKILKFLKKNKKKERLKLYNLIYQQQIKDLSIFQDYLLKDKKYLIVLKLLIKINLSNKKIFLNNEYFKQNFFEYKNLLLDLILKNYFDISDLKELIFFCIKNF